MLTFWAAWEWIKKHWKLGIAAFVALILGLQSARIAILKRRAVKQQAGADLAVREVRSAQAAKDTARIEGGLAADIKKIEQAEAEDEAARKAAGDALEDRKKLAGKWPLTCLIVACFLWAGNGLQAREDAAPLPQTPPAPTIAATGPSCGPDSDLRGLLAAVGRTRARLTGMDDAAVGDLVAVVETYQRERAALCARLEAQASIVAGLAALAAGRLELIGLARAERDDWKSGYTVQQKAALKASPGRALACVGGAIGGVDLMHDTTTLGIGIGCGWSLF